jgi:hypothetical protein
MRLLEDEAGVEGLPTGTPILLVEAKGPTAPSVVRSCSE